MPSETASSASPRKRWTRTLPGSRARSGASRASRITSAIWLGVISSSVAPSETASSSASARRTEPSQVTAPPFARPVGSGLGGLARQHDHPPIRLLADAVGGHVGIVLQGQVDGPALEGLHGVEGDGVAGHLDLTGRAQGDLPHGVLATLAVALDV